MSVSAKRHWLKLLEENRGWDVRTILSGSEINKVFDKSNEEHVDFLSLEGCWKRSDKHPWEWWLRLPWGLTGEWLLSWRLFCFPVLWRTSSKSQETDPSSALPTELSSGVGKASGLWNKWEFEGRKQTVYKSVIFSVPYHFLVKVTRTMDLLFFSS